MSGAVLHTDCPDYVPGRPLRCKCTPCVRCGYQKHTAVHGPYMDQPAGSEPWDHEYVQPLREKGSGR